MLNKNGELGTETDIGLLNETEKLQHQAQTLLEGTVELTMLTGN